MRHQLKAILSTWLWTYASCATSSDQADAVYPLDLLERVAFGSCNKQNKTDLQKLAWASVEAFNPQLWLWTGDAVYAETHSIESLDIAFAHQLAAPSYQQFLATGARIDGIWDDHDLGINDGGSEVPNIPKRQSAYLDFLQEPSSSPRRQRRGLYRSLTFGSGAKSVRVILLDTRTFRDRHVIPSVGAVARGIPVIGKLTPLAAAFSRWAANMLGWTATHQGDMLGEEQWTWLEAQLKAGSELEENKRDPPAFTILVSSVQVLTTAPVFESWGHFPVAKAKLLALLQRYKPRGLLLLSGDVHFAELAVYPPLSQDSTRSTTGEESSAVDCGSSVAEVTSSGLTHTCLSHAAGFLTQLTCRPVLAYYTAHRPDPESYYATAPNFGMLEIDWEAVGGPLLKATVEPTDPEKRGNKPALVLTRRSCPLNLPFTIERTGDGAGLEMRGAKSVEF